MPGKQNEQRPFALDLGVRMWRELDPTFQHVAKVNDLMRHEQRAQLWAGFMAAAFGAMCRDLGVSDSRLILERGIAQAVADGLEDDEKKGQH